VYCYFFDLYYIIYIESYPIGIYLCDELPKVFMDNVYYQTIWEHNKSNTKLLMKKVRKNNGND
jgi:hypothetical protein